VKLHGGCTDQTKIQIFNLPPGFAWQDLKDLGKPCGHVVFSETLGNAKETGEVRWGEVRYDEHEIAQNAMRQLNGSTLGGAQIFIEADQKSKDGTRLLIHNIPSGIAWQELKDHFSPMGRVAFCDIKGKGKGKQPGGAGGGMGMSQGIMNGGGMGALMMNLLGGKSGGGKGGKGAYRGTMVTACVTYANPMHAHVATAMLNMSTLNGAPIMVDFEYDEYNDGQTLWIGNIPSITTMNQLKDHFESIGLATWCGFN